MKYLITILAACFLVMACNAPQQQTKEQILQSKMKELKEKRTALKTLKAEIDALAEEVEGLKPKQEKPRKLVTAQPLETKDFSRLVEIQSTVQSDEIVFATSEVGGRLTSVLVKEGQRVSRGQLIATTDLEAVNKQLAELETALVLAKDVYERQKRLWDQNIGSEIQYLQAKNNKERLEKSMETAQFQLTKAKIYAPISGIVDQQFLKSGELAAPGAPVVQILNTNKVKVVAEIPESYLSVVKRGAMVTIQFPAINEERKAKITMLGRTINPANRTFKAEVELPNPKGFFKPNLLAIMLIEDFAAKDVITVSQEVIQQEVGGKKYVYVIGQGAEGANAEKRYVKTGESADGQIIVTEGLKASDQIIIKGARGLAENELIQVQTTTKENNG